MNYKAFTNEKDARKFQRKYGGMLAFKSVHAIAQNRLYRQIVSTIGINASVFPYIVWGHKEDITSRIDRVEIEYNHEEMCYKCKAIDQFEKVQYTADIDVLADISEWICLVYNDMGR